MKILQYTDIHLHDYKSFNRGDKTRLEIGLDILEMLYVNARQQGIKVILFSGDLFDSPKFLPTVVVNQTVAKFLHLSIQFPEIVCYAISGNHDHSSKNLIGKPAVTALTYIADIVPNHFKIIDDQSVVIGENVAVHGIPYYEYAENYKEMLVKANERCKAIRSGYNILMIHQTPSGLGNPNIPVDTDVQDPLYDVFDEVQCGHIHIRQEITRKFTLIGNTHHRDLGDEGLEKGFYILDTAAGTKKFVSLKGKYPEYIRVIVKIGETAPEDPYNYIVPQIVEAYDANSEQVDKSNFEIDLTSEKLMENYYKQVSGTDPELLSIGLECLRLKVED